MPFPDISPFVGGWTVTLPIVGEFGIRWYALAYVAGILLGWRYALGLARNLVIRGGQPSPVSAPQIDDLILWVTLGVILGGRLGYVAFYQPHMIWEAPGQILQIWQGGMSFHGGLIGVIVAMALFARSNGIDLLKLADTVAPAVPFGLLFGRIANFINGELWGRETSLPWGFVFPGAGGAPRHPSQLYEAALEGLVLFLLLRFATHQLLWLQRRGVVAGIFLAGYGLFRLSLENVREPDNFLSGLVEATGGLTMGMLLSVPMMLAGAWLVWRGLREPVDIVRQAPATDAPKPGTQS
ncbi:MAG: prolipoprotein diacylglyceryl transferase [Caulobacter sp.]|nr:prolipoprotein diacylglyceryl transferase [Caulobacter sp.]